VSIPVQIGEPNTILKAFLADLNAYVEPYNGENDWGGWTPTNSVATSNHLGGTAVDFNWNDHPMGPAAEDPTAGWQGSSLIAGDEVPAVRTLLDFYEGMVYWGADWTTPKDSMHFQMGYGTYDGGNTGDAWTPAMHSDASCMDFIKRKIRPDMFSVYRRGGTSQNGTVWPADVTTGVAPPSSPTPPPSTVTTGPTPVQPVGDTTSPAGTDPATVLVAATGVSADTAAKILPDVTQGLIDSQCTNINRIAMWLAQIGEESAGFTATVEIGTIDGTTYQGRTWIQITGQANYASFSQWAYANNVPGVTSATYFVDNPAALGDLQYAAIGPAWYWTIARPQINGLCDNSDVVGVTQAINGGQNGIDDRTRRWNLALAQGNDLLALIQQSTTTTTPGGALMALTDDEQQELLDKVRYIFDQVGPRLPAWGSASSFGIYPDGSEMTERDGLIAKLNAIVTALAAPANVINTPAVCQISKWLNQGAAAAPAPVSTAPVVAPSTVRPSPPPIS
jgi:putative chitinase